jgi:hypothetical protein
MTAQRIEAAAISGASRCVWDTVADKSALRTKRSSGERDFYFLNIKSDAKRHRIIMPITTKLGRRFMCAEDSAAPARRLRQERRNWSMYAPSGGYSSFQSVSVHS